MAGNWDEPQGRAGSTGSACRDDLLKIFFIKDGSGLGNIAHNRKSAHEWLDALLDNLERGEGTLDNEFMEKVTFEFRAMTQKELDALPEV